MTIIPAQPRRNGSARYADVMEVCGCFSKELKEIGLKRRFLSFYPGSLGLPIDSDRSIHCIPRKSKECPTSKPFLVSCEIESDPFEHPLEHLIRQNGFKKPGACDWLRNRLGIESLNLSYPV